MEQVRKWYKGQGLSQRSARIVPCRSGPERFVGAPALFRDRHVPLLLPAASCALWWGNGWLLLEAEPVRVAVVAAVVLQSSWRCETELVGSCWRVCEVHGLCPLGCSCALQ